MRAIWQLALVLCCITAGDANAQSPPSMAFVCSDPNGKAFYAKGGLVTEKDRGWRDAVITKGQIMVLVGPENGPGGAEVKVRDASRGLMSYAAEGWKVSLTSYDKASGTMRVDVRLNETNSETYLVNDAQSDQPTLIYTQIRGGGLILNSTIMTANCKRI